MGGSVGQARDIGILLLFGDLKRAEKGKFLTFGNLCHNLTE